MKRKIYLFFVFKEFSTAYVDANPGKVSDNPDTILVVAFAIIMLNTDLHSPNVKRKMSKEQFTRNLRGMLDGDPCWDGEALPFEWLLKRSMVFSKCGRSFLGPSRRGKASWLARKFLSTSLSNALHVERRYLAYQVRFASDLALKQIYLHDVKSCRHDIKLSRQA